MASIRKISAFLAAFCLLVLLHSCTTEKNTWLIRKFHTTCTHFNGYFWGKMSYNEGLDKLKSTHKDDYTDILPVYIYAESNEVQSIFPQMDRAIKKCQTMIENHTITDKAHHEIADANRYIKYCYMLMAQANLYKNEYIASTDQLDYASREYRNTDVRYDAMIWEARAFNQMGAVSKSEELIDYLKDNKQLPKKMYAELYAMIADYYERIGDWENVQKWLTKAVKEEKNKTTRARYYFILGQLTSRMGQNQKAYNFYSLVLKNKPLPELEFEATIFRAMLFMGGDKENQKVKAELTKMLKPTKYSDERDQIYYALAKIALKEGDKPLYIKYLNKSIRVSTTNATQKGISYLDLADYNFDQEEYPRSKRYFDSTLTALPKTFHGRDSIVAKKEHLQKLVTYLDIITYQDSIQKIANMSKPDRDKFIKDMIASMKKQEEDAKQKKADSAIIAQNIASNNSSAPAVANGKWYFYNPASLQQGIAEFNKMWGNRVLEDDWRRSKKTINANNLGNPGETAAADSAKANTKTAKAGKDSANDKYNEAFYLKHLPLTETAMKKSVDSVIDAYYNAGAIYKEYLHNYRKSSAEFEELLTRFPDNKYKLIVYYELYVIYDKMHNDERRDYYKNILLTKYPDTQYALLISNPEKYNQQRAATQQEMLRLYTATMASYNAENYLQVLSNCKQADSLFPESEYTPKFAFLKAVAIGSTEGLDAYKNALTKVTILYPKDSVKQLAQSILDYLNKRPMDNAKTDSITVTYSPEKDTSYLWIVLVNNSESLKMNGLQAALTDMNAKTFSQDNLQSDEIFLNEKQVMIIMKSFKSFDQARNYFNFINEDPKLFEKLSPNSYQHFFISQHNFMLLFNHKKVDEYMNFFREKMI